MAHDVFISHATEDKAAAGAVCQALEATGLACWVAPRDIEPGADWADSIVGALKTSRAMVLVFSTHAGDSKHVRKELAVAVDAGVPIVPVRIDDAPLEGTMQYYLSDTHWMQASATPTAEEVAALVPTVRTAVKTGASPGGSGAAVRKRRARGRLLAALVAGAVLVGSGVVAYVFGPWGRDAPESESTAPASTMAAVPETGAVDPQSVDPAGGVVATWEASDGFVPQAVAVEGDRAYVACGGTRGGVNVLDVEDPYSPVRLGLGGTGWNLTSVAVEGDVAFAAGRHSDSSRDCVVVLDVTSSEDPVMLAEYEPEDVHIGEDEGSNVVAHEDFLVLGTPSGIELVDVSQPDNPGYLWSREIGTGGAACGVAIIDHDYWSELDGDLLIVAAGTDGVLFYDLGDPRSPELLGRYESPGAATEIFHGKRGAIVTLGEAGVMALFIPEGNRPSPEGWSVFEYSDTSVPTAQIAGIDVNVFFSWGADGDPSAGVSRLVAFTTVVDGEEAAVFEGTVLDLAVSVRYLYAVVEGVGLRIHDVRDLLEEG